MNADTANGSVSGSCTDKAGNSAGQSYSYKYDGTAPGIHFEGQSPAKNANGWNNTNVTLSWTCSDATSGAAAPGDSASVTTEGTGQQATGHCADNAGNTSNSTDGNVNIDKTDPGISFTGQSPAKNGNGWNNSDVTLSWSCSDALSGPVAAADSASVTSEGQHQQKTGHCADKAGNTSSSTDGDVNLDKTKPSLNPTVSPNPVLLNGAATASPNASDGLSGLASASCPSVDTSTLGSHTVTCSATDKAGNATSKDATYAVVAKFSGFLSPLNADPTVINVGTAGRTYPIKYQLTDANGAFITNAVTGTTINVAKVACSNMSGDPTDLIDYAASTGGTALRYDSTANQYVYNWATPTTKNTCYRLTVTPPDGQARVALFQMK